MNVSLDPITGTDQKEGTYYARIWEVYQMKKPRDCVTRPMTSVQTRIKTIVKETVRFAACFRSIETMRKSGHSDEDIIRLSTALFNKVKVAHPREDIGKPFRFLKCWELVRDLPKFRAGTAGTPVNETGSEEGTGGGLNDRNSASNVTGKPSEDCARPDGRRKAKEELAVQNIRAKKLKLAEHAVRLQEQHVEELNRRNEILLFSNGPGGRESEMAREYFALKQAEALEKLKERIRKNESAKVLDSDRVGDTVETTETEP